MTFDTKQLLADSLAAIAACEFSAALEDQRITLLGKKGKVTEALKTLGSVGPEERKTLGAALNEIKKDITAAIDAKKADLTRNELNARLAHEKMDVTLPARDIPRGRIHPVTKVTEEITEIFARMGFSVAEGPDIEDDTHNFTALNIPESHPARQMHDTFYLHGNGDGKTLLRTHTSPVQIRTMSAGRPPFRVIAPGSTYRCDSDITHTPMFHQVEGFVIDKGIHMGHLKGCISEFLKTFFELDDVPVRFRPSFFPFTEPSAEVDIGCKRSHEAIEIGAPSLSSSPQAGGTEEGWLEVMGCGMVHPNVLKNCNLDPEEWQGFAFGVGIERLAMLKYGIPDLRTFFENDVRWLEYYGFMP
ncbi:MAG: phenylalanine--tRNA ligase subunit alpha [Pseudomonadota bacterium]|nr:phenylalanine--tRNA ligase subunit alpha [Pseudomonadota bacterium]MDE3037833.1 phenylalanine--tRNA ligase subunit alpha [Pseudomonadota bacterium]